MHPTVRFKSRPVAPHPDEAETKRVPAAIAAQPVASPSPAVPTTTKRPEGVTVYSELTRIRFSVSVLDHSWQSQVDDIKMRQIWPYKHGSQPWPMPEQLPDDLVEALAADDRDASSNMRDSILPQLRKIHEDAIVQLKMVPNHKQDDAGLFQGVIGAALKPTSVKDLQLGRVNRNRFSPLVLYLDELLRQVGELQEKPVP